MVTHHWWGRSWQTCIDVEPGTARYLGACLGHHLGHVWGSTCLGQHLRHVWGILRYPRCCMHLWCRFYELHTYCCCWWMMISKSIFVMFISKQIILYNNESLVMILHNDDIQGWLCLLLCLEKGDWGAGGEQEGRQRPGHCQLDSSWVVIIGHFWCGDGDWILICIQTLDSRGPKTLSHEGCSNHFRPISLLSI